MNILLLAAGLILLPLIFAYVGAAFLAAGLALRELSRRRHSGDPRSSRPPANS